MSSVALQIHMEIRITEIISAIYKKNWRWSKTLSVSESGSQIVIDQKLIKLDDDLRLVSFASHSDTRGFLSVMCFSEMEMFHPQRIFFQYNLEVGVQRGLHAHRECSQAFICVAGSIEVLVSNGLEKFSLVLDSPDIALVIPPLIWSIQTPLQDNSRLLVLASDEYDEADYIYDLNELLALRRRALERKLQNADRAD